MDDPCAWEPIAGGTWRDEFFRLWVCRDRWQEPAVDEVERVRDRFRRMITGEEEEVEEEGGGDEEEEAVSDAAGAGDAAAAPTMTTAAAEAERGSIKVCVRMRPRGVNAPRAGPASGDEGATGVVLPLHQRLQIIKAQQGPGCSTGDAMVRERGEVGGLSHDTLIHTLVACITQ